MPISASPDRPKILAAELVETDSLLFVSHRARRGSNAVPGCFLSVWLSGWTVACLGLLIALVFNPGFFLLLFAIPFWASWVFVAALLASGLLGVERLGVTKDGVGYEYRVVRPWVRRFLPRSEILSVASVVASVDSDSGGTEHAVEIVATGRKQIFGKGLEESECRWLAWKIGVFLNLQAPGPGTHEPAEDVPGERPTDCEWTLEDDGDAVRFRNAGQWQGKLVFGLLFINLFWNGIVSVFVILLWGGGPGAAPKGDEWWHLFLFLIPFQLIGLGMALALLATIAGAFRRTTWTFRQGSVECRQVWFGLGFTRRHELDQGCQLRAGERTENPRFKFQSGGDTPTDDTRFELAIVRSDEAVVCAIRKLTLGEARWIKAELETRRPGWFNH